MLVATGEAVQTLADQGTILAEVVDPHTPGDIELVGTVVAVVDATGDALVRTGNGEEYLVDGLTAAPGELVTVTVGNAHVLGSADHTPLIGASVLSPTQTEGQLLTVGIGSEGELVTLGTQDGDTGGGTGDPVQGIVGTVTDVLDGVVPGSTDGTGLPTTGVVDGVVDTVTGILGPGN